MINNKNTTTTYFVENGSKKENMKFVECDGCKENIPLIEKECDCGGIFVHACQSETSKFIKGDKIEIKEFATVQKDDGTITYYLECQKCSDIRFVKVKVLN